MRAIAHGSQTIEGGNTQAGGEVSIRTAADGNLVERKSQLAGDLLRLLEERHHRRRPLQWRAIDAAFNLQLAFLIDRAQRTNLAHHQVAIEVAGDPEIEFALGFGGHHVSASATANDAGVQGDAALEVRHGSHRLNLMRQLKYRVLPFLEVEPGMRSHPTDPDGERTDAFARGFQGSAATCRLAHQNGL